MTDEMPRTAVVSDREILAQFGGSDCPVSTVPDIAENLPIKRDAVRMRLKTLEEEGEVESKTVGSRAVVWWRV